MQVQHNCKPFVKTDYGINFHGFGFEVDGAGSSTDHEFSISASANDGTYGRDGNKVSFELNNAESAESGFKSFNFFWAINTFDAAGYDYTYEMLSAAAVSKAPAP